MYPAYNVEVFLPPQALALCWVPWEVDRTVWSQECSPSLWTGVIETYRHTGSGWRGYCFQTHFVHVTRKFLNPSVEKISQLKMKLPTEMHLLLGFLLELINIRRCISAGHLADCQRNDNGYSGTILENRFFCKLRQDRYKQINRTLNHVWFLRCHSTENPSQGFGR